MALSFSWLVYIGFLFSWGLGRAAVCDCGTPRTFLLPFFLICILLKKKDWISSLFLSQKRSVLGVITVIICIKQSNTLVIFTNLFQSSINMFYSIEPKALITEEDVIFCWLYNCRRHTSLWPGLNIYQYMSALNLTTPYSPDIFCKPRTYLAELIQRCI